MSNYNFQEELSIVKSILKEAGCYYEYIVERVNYLHNVPDIWKDFEHRGISGQKFSAKLFVYLFDANQVSFNFCQTEHGTDYWREKRNNITNIYKKRVIMPLVKRCLLKFKRMGILDRFTEEYGFEKYSKWPYNGKDEYMVKVFSSEMYLRKASSSYANIEFYMLHLFTWPRSRYGEEYWTNVSNKLYKLSRYRPW